MKYISHIKELVSGIIENELVTRDTEAYDALTALYNHLDTLEEVYKYMPYKDPGPVIQKLEQSLAQANTRNQELKKVIENLNEELEQKNTNIKELRAERKDLENNVTTLENQIQDQFGSLKQKQDEIDFLIE